jgi:phosphoserine phosphatase
MMTIATLRELAARIERELGLSPDKAMEYADAIGDTPELDAAGKVVIRDWSNKVIDRISISVS